MGSVRVLVVRAAGINCDEEIVHCWRLAGARPDLLHVNELVANPRLLDDYAVVTIPGGFSYGDDLGAGVILAQRMQHELASPLREFVDRGGGVFGVCNGFQALVKMGLLPGGVFGRDSLTVTYNDSAKFEARWVKLEVCTDKCPFLGERAADTERAARFSPRGRSEPKQAAARQEPRPPLMPSGRVLELPVEHAEGKVVTATPAIAEQLLANGQVALRYVDDQGRTDRYPANPNGSVAGIAGLCDPTGRIFGLMPHPDRHFDHTQHPCWTSRTATPFGRGQGEGTPADGLTIFLNAVRHWCGATA